MNNRAKFHTDLIWNDGALGFFKECHHNEMSSSLASVTHPKTFMIKSVNELLLQKKFHDTVWYTEHWNKGVHVVLCHEISCFLMLVS